MSEDLPPSVVHRVVADFALAGGVSTGTVALVVALFGAFVDLETVPALILGGGVLLVLGLLAGSFGGWVLGLCHDAWPDSPVLWPLGFVVGAAFAFPIALFAGPDPDSVLAAMCVVSGLLGPPFGLLWAAWLLIDQRGRDPRPILVVLAIGMGVAYLVVGGLLSMFLIRGTLTTPPPQTPPVMAPPGP